MKKICFILACIFFINVFTVNYVKAEENDTYILRVQIFNNKKTDKKIDIQSNNSDIVLPEEEIGDGSIKIEDLLDSETGKFEGEIDKKFKDYETFKKAKIKVIEYIPIVGKIYKIGQEIFDALSGVYSDLFRIDHSRDVKVSTWYTYRNFYHYLYAYKSSSNIWKQVGQSLSRYYYVHYEIQYYNKELGEYDKKYYAFTHSKGCSPAKILKAPNYMNYKNLKELAYKAYITNKPYYERY